MKKKNEFEKLLRAYFLSMLLIVCLTATAAGLLTARASTESIMFGSNAEGRSVGVYVSAASPTDEGAPDKLYTLTVGKESYTLDGSVLRRAGEIAKYAPAPLGNLWRLAGNVRALFE